jgi:hypothetical protein
MCTLLLILLSTYAQYQPYTLSPTRWSNTLDLINHNSANTVAIKFETMNSNTDNTGDKTPALPDPNWLPAGRKPKSASTQRSASRAPSKSAKKASKQPPSKRSSTGMHNQDSDISKDRQKKKTPLPLDKINGDIRNMFTVTGTGPTTTLPYIPHPLHVTKLMKSVTKKARSVSPKTRATNSITNDTPAKTTPITKTTTQTKNITQQNDNTKKTTTNHKNKTTTTHTLTQSPMATAPAKIPYPTRTFFIPTAPMVGPPTTTTPGETTTANPLTQVGTINPPFQSPMRTTPFTTSLVLKASDSAMVSAQTQQQPPGTTVTPASISTLQQAAGTAKTVHLLEALPVSQAPPDFVPYKFQPVQIPPIQFYTDPPPATVEQQAVQPDQTGDAIMQQGTPDVQIHHSLDLPPTTVEQLEQPEEKVDTIMQEGTLGTTPPPLHVSEPLGGNDEFPQPDDPLELDPSAAQESDEGYATPTNEGTIEETATDKENTEDNPSVDESIVQTAGDASTATHKSNDDSPTNGTNQESQTKLVEQSLSQRSQSSGDLTNTTERTAMTPPRNNRTDNMEIDSDDEDATEDVNTMCPHPNHFKTFWRADYVTFIPNNTNPILTVADKLGETLAILQTIDKDTSVYPYESNPRLKPICDPAEFQALGTELYSYADKNNLWKYPKKEMKTCRLILCLAMNSDFHSTCEAYNRMAEDSQLYPRSLNHPRIARAGFFPMSHPHQMSEVLLKMLLYELKRPIGLEWRKAVPSIDLSDDDAKPGTNGRIDIPAAITVECREGDEPTI